MRKIVIDFGMDFSPEPYSQCWIWTGNIYKGYGRVGHGLAHRKFYEHYIGPIPEGKQLHHKCNTPSCVNPAHLAVIHPSDHPRITFSGKTKCRNGHPWTTETTYRRPNGTRLCRECCRVLDRVRHTKPERREYNRQWSRNKKRQIRIALGI